MHIECPCRVKCVQTGFRARRLAVSRGPSTAISPMVHEPMQYRVESHQFWRLALICSEVIRYRRHRRRRKSPHLSHSEHSDHPKTGGPNGRAGHGRDAGDAPAGNQRPCERTIWADRRD
jgi:hypothetical protein